RSRIRAPRREAAAPADLSPRPPRRAGDRPDPAASLAAGNARRFPLRKRDRARRRARSPARSVLVRVYVRGDGVFRLALPEAPGDVVLGAPVGGGGEDLLGRVVLDELAEALALLACRDREERGHVGD